MAPGPLLSLVVSETLRGNRLNGILIALAPLLTDLPIVLISIFLLKALSGSDILLGLLNIFGSIFLFYIGIKNLRLRKTRDISVRDYSRSIKYGVIANLLSPHPYLFWITVGAPTFIKASEIERISGYFFIAGFYLLLIGSKVIIAFVTGFFNNFLKGKTYQNLMRLMGLIIIVFAIAMLFDGVDSIL